MQAQAQDITSVLWLIGIAMTIMMGILSIYGYWIWDLHKKTGKTVSGDDCERRNEKHYGDVEKLRLEIKTDFKELEIKLLDQQKSYFKIFADIVKNMNTRGHDVG